MTMNPIQPNIAHLFNTQPISAGTKSSGGLTSGFANILSESLDAAVQSDQIDKSSTLELLMGENDDLSGLLIDMQKAELSLQLTLQIRNKVIDAYNEVMRMTV
jgi:flagellar hook-basal body complex protein FliE